MSKLALLIILIVALSGCTDDPVRPHVFGENQATKDYIKSLNSTIVETGVLPCLANKACEGMFLIRIYAVRESLLASKTDWNLILTANYHISKELFSHYGKMVYEINTSYKGPGTDRYGKKMMIDWALLTVKGVEASKINWDGMNWLQFTQGFVECRARNTDASQWLDDFRQEYGVK